MTKELTGENVKCQYCGKEFYVTQTRLKKSNTLTCSRECASKLKKELYKDIRKCEICENDFIVRKSSTQRFCSMSCQIEWQKTNVGHKNPKFLGKTLPCDYCGKIIDVGKNKLDTREHHFCSTQCRQRWYSECFSQSEEWKEKSRIRGAEITKHMSLNTKPQRILNTLLNQMNINYSNEYNVKYYSVDNYLIDYNLMIEVMGDYWHYNPSTEDNKEPSASQIKTIIKDKAKHTYIKKYYDIEVLYLWENDLYNNINVCESLINEYIKQKGMMDNYHSFNYYIDKNDNLILSNKLINIDY